MTTNESRKNASTPQSWAEAVTKNLKPPEIRGYGIRKNVTKNLNFKPVSLMETVSGMKPKEKKVLCIGGTPFKLGYKIQDLNADVDLIIESIIEQLGEIQSCFELDSKRKMIFFKFIDNEREVVDITAFKHIKFNSYPSKSIKVVIKTKKNNEIPKNLEINDIKVVLLWKGGQSVCTYCNKNDHWKYNCPEIKLKNEKKLKRSRDSNPKNIIQKFFIDKDIEIANNEEKNKKNTETTLVEDYINTNGAKEAHLISVKHVESENHSEVISKSNELRNEDLLDKAKESANILFKKNSIVNLIDAESCVSRETIKIHNRNNLKVSNVRRTLIRRIALAKKSDTIEDLKRKSKKREEIKSIRTEENINSKESDVPCESLDKSMEGSPSQIVATAESFSSSAGSGNTQSTLTEKEIAIKETRDKSFKNPNSSIEDGFS
ncbi:hypothetical protein AYI69_g4734, partial [Smittium culicis]